MKAVFTDAALSDLDEILAYTATEYPSLVAPVEQRIRDVVARVETWPLSARLLEDPAGIHVVPLIRHPFKIFYRVEQDQILILHIHHAARRPWAG
jgi:toxin ParE1/3/4